MNLPPETDEHGIYTDPTPTKKRIAYTIGALWLVAVVAGLRAAGVW